MSKFKHYPILAVLPALMLAAACSDTSEPVTQIDQQITDDVALYVADMTADDLFLLGREMGNFMVGGAMTLPPEGPPEPPRFSDLTISRDVTFYDSLDVEQESYHWLETATIHLVFHMEGSHTRTGERGTIDVAVTRDRDMWLTGLVGQEEQHTWNGTGSTDETRSVISDENGDRSYDMSATSTVEDLVIELPHEENPWPQSGKITRVVHVEVVSGGETVVRDRTVVIEFDGDQYVTMTVDGEEFELDLAQRQPHRRDRLHM